MEGGAAKDHVWGACANVGGGRGGEKRGLRAETDTQANASSTPGHQQPLLPVQSVKAGYEPASQGTPVQKSAGSQ